ncbi:DEAD/DEAH box helicase [Vibrio cincinnatiensis]|jgi:superfamily II DNA/RNA helicase|uniref:Superfamily II DNA and RNA helicase n=1 Tax=Vibrio cincinnatiensis DSM 19608 TaxID=1123491 RepID=A0A1T4PZB8_VIBCI|nr:DEAD/DEAH box helicase [Vibrio cincinnatiensis]MCG3721013.1 DEAD/DEAH box helicase [Vibrio cincinnatiensis]MCG3735580.1 DEAD/DEAH box helicase [Vibrio cincinnatiensis]MCG3745548.1 DEAD/DEAH box helicase [Vibrio cincinnatiensis]MCG3760657.1 DEAD/DEAH box helicase [Vibrio cincinnatiensis]MCG3763962.1 DEAD/DEAH box helicase [Vibrio cincinnatiensis]
MSFTQLGLSEALIQSVSELGYQKPTTIQRKAIPVILQGLDLIAAAQTGTGKTASFVLPILHKLQNSTTQRKKRIRALILVPTRELAIQVAKNAEQYAKYTGLTTLAMFGGVDEQAQKQHLIEGVDLLVATPGRLLDMYGQRAVHFDEVEMVVLDEADRMLDMGFIEPINKIIDRLPRDAQFLLFSATLSHKVRDLAKTAVTDPYEISIAANQASKTNIEQWLITVDKDKKSALLSHLITENNWDQALIFIETKHGAAKLVAQLEKRGIYAEAFHSGRSQAIRVQLLEDFKAGKIQYMVATGVGARGIDIQGLSRVVNYDLPFPADEYVHRIGRTGRADEKGEAISFVSKDNFKNLCMIESRLGHLIERRVIEGFEPSKPVPISILNYVPKHKREQSND